MKTKKTLLALAITTSIISGFSVNLYAQEAEDNSATNEDIEKISIVGSRVKGRGSLDTAAPVDVISGDDLVNQGANDIGDLIPIMSVVLLWLMKIINHKLEVSFED